MDVISDALRVIRLRGALFLNAEFREPWCINAPSTDDLRKVLPPPHQPVAICHLFVEGRCWVQMNDGEPIAVEAGDVVTLPYGDAHVIGCGRNNARVTPREAVAIKMPEVARMRYGGDGRPTIAICGWFNFDRQVASPVMGALPRLFRTSVGIPPMQYLTQWRIALAAHLLRGDQLTLAQIAEQVGYESEAAFSRAFKREYGKPPATWRRLGESAA